MLERGVIGRRTEPVANDVERGAIRRFVEILGLSDPVYSDDEQARAAGFRGILAPFSFPLGFRSALNLEALFSREKVSLIPTDQTLELFRHICVGDRIHVVAMIANVTERKGPNGVVDIVLLEEEGRDDDGQLVYRAQKTVMVRPVLARSRG